eukprot:scaffold17585_cov99-Phaeocystis_antarctica.AAC.2
MESVAAAAREACFAAAASGAPSGGEWSASAPRLSRLVPEPIGTICLCEVEWLMAPAGLSSEPTTSTLGAVVAMYSR